MVNLFRTPRQIILASQSPRRQHFLKELGIEYTLCHELLLAKEENTKKHPALANNLSSAKAEFDASAAVGERATFGIRPETGEVSAFGVRAKDDEEERPNHLELPEAYVFRTALGKALDAMQDTGFIQAHSPANDEENPRLESPRDVGDVGNEGNGVGLNAKFASVLDMSKKENLNLSYLVEKYCFNQGMICHSTMTTEILTKNLLVSLPETLPKNLFSEQGKLSAGQNKLPESLLGEQHKLPHKQGRDKLQLPLFISADTIVALDSEILGKPQDEADALDMLSRMVGREHKVLTTVCVADLDANCVYAFTDIAHVHFAPWSTQLLESYVKTGDPMDKAGSYGIQGVGMFLSDGIQGSWDTVAGLPVAKLLELLLHCDAIQIAPQ